MKDDWLDRLIKRASKGNRAAFDTLWDINLDHMLGQIRKMMRSDDYTEEIMQKAALSTFKGIRFYRGDCAFNSWLYKIIHNQCLMCIRENKHDAFRKASIFKEYQNRAHEMMRFEHRHDEILAARQRLRKINGILQTMNPTEAPVVFCRLVKEMSNEETGTALRLSPAAVKSRLHRGRKTLFKKLDIKKKAANYD